VRCTTLDLSGAVLWEEKQPVSVEPLSSRKLLTVAKARLLEGRAPGAVFLEAWLLQAVSRAAHPGTRE